MKYHIDINSGIGYPISKGYIRYLLKPLEGKHCDVRINSYGGDTQTALDIRQQFLDHGDVTCYIFGMTASAATILAMGAKTIKMSRYALMLIHPASFWVDEWGQMNAEKIAETIRELSDMKGTLHTVDDIVAALYALRTGKTKDAMLELMKKEEWLTAEQCLEIGLIDEVIEEGEKPKITSQRRDLFVANHIPLPPEESFEAEAEEPHGFKKFLTDMFNFFTSRSDQTVVEQLQQICGKDMDDTPSHQSDETPDVPGNAQTDGEEPAPPQTNTTNFNMKKLTNLAALLAVTSLAANEDGSIQLTAEQSQTIEDKLGELQSQVTELTGQVESLKGADGDTTTHLENEKEDGAMSEIGDARGMFNLVKDLI